MGNEHEFSDVAIIGGGPVGMALGCELIRHGLSVHIIDKAKETKDYSRAPVFWPRAQEALDLMGLNHLWNGRTVPMSRVHVSVYGKAASNVVALDAGPSAHAAPMLVGQDVTEQIFDAHLQTLGAPVERGCEAVAIAEDADGYSISVRDENGERVIRSRWLVGCEGSKSVVRESLGFGWQGHPLKGLMVPLADANVRWPLPIGEGDVFVSLTDRGYLLTMRLPERQRIIVAVPDTTPPGEEPSITLDGLESLLSEAIGGPVELSDPLWLTVVRYGNHLADTFRKGRAFLAGDAAHSIAPLSGQGMNTGVQDAFDLAWKLAYVHKGWAPETLLDSYEADRRPVAERLVHATDRFFKVVHEPGSIQKRLMRAAAPAALAFEHVRETFAEFYTELDVAYPHSPLNDSSRRAGPAPGSHVIDGPLVRWPDLEPIRLYDMLRGVRWTAIVFTGPHSSREQTEALAAGLDALQRAVGAERLQTGLVMGAARAPEGFEAKGKTYHCALDALLGLHDAYVAHKGALLLVRPDGYVALHRTAEAADFEAADRLIARIFAQRRPGASRSAA